MKQRISFIEWMKALGMFLIIYGHTNGHSIFNPTLPVNLKQVGVVFFLISTGYLLANEGRGWRKVFYYRLFELFLFGIAVSVLMSLVRLYTVGDPNESNYLPFMLGINVFFNAFPANPSLWYIGTYIHVLILWALLLRNVRIRPWMFAVVIPAEIIVRLVLMERAGDFIAYQALTNWVSILMFGMYLGQQSIGDRFENPAPGLLMYGAGFAAVTWVWMFVTHSMGVTSSNPFGRLPVGNAQMTVLATSISISIVYFMWAIFGFQILRRLKAGSVAQFFGRNSMLCFMLHMPLIYLISGWLYELPVIETNRYVRLIVNILVFYVGLCLFSEWLRRVVKPVALRNWIEARFLKLKDGRKSTAH